MLFCSLFKIFLLNGTACCFVHCLLQGESPLDVVPPSENESTYLLAMLKREPGCVICRIIACFSALETGIEDTSPGC